MTIGEVLRRRRAECGLGQDDLASRLGVTQQTVSRWENGQGLPRPKRVAELAELLALDPAELHRAAGYLPEADTGPADLTASLAGLSEDELMDLIERAWGQLRARRRRSGQARAD